MTRGRRKKDRDGPERRCIATGESGPTAALIRFVLDPEGRVAPDLAERLPGRGVWLTADRGLVAKAEAKNLFARAFRQAVPRTEGLADQLEALLAERLVGILGLARKAGKAVTGFEKTRERLRSGKAGMLLAARDGAEDGRRKLAALAEGTAIPVCTCLDAQELGLAFGREFAIHAALDAGGFADRAVREATRLEGLRPPDGRPQGLRPSIRNAKHAPATAAESDGRQGDRTRSGSGQDG